jgi:hypothetical protein
MACIGSHSRIQYGINLNLQGSRWETTQYFDIANIEGVDVILRTPFMSGIGALLDMSESPPQLIPKVSRMGVMGQANQPHCSIPEASIPELVDDSAFSTAATNGSNG